MLSSSATEKQVARLADHAAAMCKAAKEAVLEHVNAVTEIKRARATDTGAQPDVLIDATEVIQAIRQDLNGWLDRIEPLR